MKNNSNNIKTSFQILFVAVELFKCFVKTSSIAQPTGRFNFLHDVYSGSQAWSYSFPCHFIMCVCSRSVTSDSATPRTVARLAPLSMEFSRQEYWSGLPFPTQGDLPDSGLEPMSPTLTASWVPPGKPSMEIQVKDPKTNGQT